MSRALLTGVTGLVGHRLAHALAAEHEVVGVCRRAPDHAPFTSVVIDLSKEWTWRSLPARADVVIHLAQSDNWQAPDAALDVFAVNLASAARLLDYAANAGASHFVLMSTGGLYGASDVPLTESAPLRLGDGPLRYYFETKRSAEEFAGVYRDRMAVSILRPFFIYGSGQRLPKLVPRLIDALTAGRAVPIRGQSGTILNPVHVDDVVRVVQACLAQRHSGLVNVAGGQVTSIRDMASRIGRLFDVTPQFQAEPGDAEQFVSDTAVMRRLIGAEPIGFDEGIGSILADGVPR